MNCSNCGAAVRVEQGRLPECGYCRSTHAPAIGQDGVRVTGGPVGRDCPICSIPLVAGAAGRFPVAVCPRCAGLLVSMRSFAKLAGHLRSVSRKSEEAPEPPDPAELERRLFCPGCGAHMHTHRYCGPGNIVIDNCAVCELNWLDERELQRVATAPDASDVLPRRHFGELA